MKIFTYFFLFTALLFIGKSKAKAQTVAGITDIGVGYFNNHQFATFNTITGTPPTLTGSLAGNDFSIAFSGNTRSLLSLFPNYGPNLPLNSGSFSVTTVDLNYTQVPATNTITFTNNLQPLDQMHVIDIENDESVTFQFLDEVGIPVPLAGNVKVISLSNISPTASLNFHDATTLGINTAPNKTNTQNTNQGFSFVMLTNVIRTIRFVQTVASLGGSWDFTFSKGAPDRGDAPATYGDATHLALASRLRLGLLGGDADGVNYSSDATGDNIALSGTVINDEDGVVSLPVINNSGTNGQVISSYAVSVSITNTTGADANVIAWIDWNGNGIFDAVEGLTATTVPTGSANVNRTFTWNNVTLNGTNGRTGTFLRIRTTTGVLVTTSATGFAVDGEVEDYFIPFAITLPVSLNSFTAKVSECKTVLLKWDVTGAVDFSSFQIERSNDGVKYKKVKDIPYDASLNSYIYEEKDLIDGKYFYRLKLVDVDQQYQYTDLRVVQIKCNTDKISGYPNPLRDKYTVLGLQVGDEVQLINNIGQVLLNSKTGHRQLEIDFLKYNKGHYFLIVYRGKEQVAKMSVVKQ